MEEISHESIEHVAASSICAFVTQQMIAVSDEPQAFERAEYKKGSDFDRLFTHHSHPLIYTSPKYTKTSTMNAALALVFFACVTGSMAADARSQVFGQLVQQGQTVVQAVLTQLQQQVLQIVQQAVGQLSSLVGSMGRLAIDVSGIPDQIRPIVGNLINQLLVQLLGSVQGLIGGTSSTRPSRIRLSPSILLGRASIDIGAIFSGFLAEIQGAITGIGNHLVNQGLAAVLGGIGGSRGINDIFACE